MTQTLRAAGALALAVPILASGCAAFRYARLDAPAGKRALGLEFGTERAAVAARARRRRDRGPRRPGRRGRAHRGALPGRAGEGPVPAALRPARPVCRRARGARVGRGRARGRGAQGARRARPDRRRAGGRRRHARARRGLGPARLDDHRHAGRRLRRALALPGRVRRRLAARRRRRAARAAARGRRARARGPGRDGDAARRGEHHVRRLPAGRGRSGLLHRPVPRRAAPPP